MSILETFYILFKADTANLKKGVGEVDKLAQQASASFFNLSHSIALAAGAIVSAASLFNTITSVHELGNVARELNVNVESLDAWGQAVQRTGGSAQQFQSTLRSLATHLNTTPDVALRALPKLAESFSKMNQATANFYGKSLGLDQSTIYLLQQGRREVEATIQQQKELGLVTQKDVEVTRKFDNALYDLGRVFQSFQRDLVLPALPALIKGLEYFIEHKDLIKGALIGIGIGLTAFGAAAFFANVGANTLRLSLAALLALFALVFEDFKKFKEGSRSVIGRVQSRIQGLRRQANSAVSKLPVWAQKLIGARAPDYALRGLPASGAANVTNTVNVGDVTIQTNATDGKDVAASVGTWFDNLWQANSHFDNGVTI